MCGGPTATLVVPILALSGATSHWTVIAAVLPGRRSMQGARGAGSFGGSRQFDPSHTVGIGCVAKTGIGVLVPPAAVGAGQGARFRCVGFLLGLRVVLGDARGGVRHARKQARNLEPP